MFYRDTVLPYLFLRVFYAASMFFIWFRNWVVTAIFLFYNFYCMPFWIMQVKAFIEFRFFFFILAGNNTQYLISLRQIITITYYCGNSDVISISWVTTKYQLQWQCLNLGNIYVILYHFSNPGQCWLLYMLKLLKELRAVVGLNIRKRQGIITPYNTNKKIL